MTEHLGLSEIRVPTKPVVCQTMLGEIALCGVPMLGQAQAEGNGGIRDIWKHMLVSHVNRS